jgi:DNA-binding MarR family transcriptional regulator
VTRLERDGFVRREADPADRRAARISLTESGAQVLREGMKTHFDGVRNRFLSRFSDAELIQLAEFWDRLADESRDDESERAASR